MKTDVTVVFSKGIKMEAALDQAEKAADDVKVSIRGGQVKMTTVQKLTA